MPAINQRHPESIHFHVFGGMCVEICKTNTCFCKIIHIRCFDLTAEHPHIRIAHVVGKNYHDVGRFAEVPAFGATDCAFASP